MSKSYRHIQQYEKEMLELKSEGVTVREIGERFGMTYEQTHVFLKDTTENNANFQKE